METCLPHPRFPCLKPEFQPWDEHKLLGSCGCEGSESCTLIITRLFWKAEQKYCITCCKQRLRILVLRNVGVFSQQATVFPSLRFSLRKGSLCPDWFIKKLPRLIFHVWTYKTILTALQKPQAGTSRPWSLSEMNFNSLVWNGFKGVSEEKLWLVVRQVWRQLLLNKPVFFFF